MIDNKQHTKEEYESFVAQLDLSQLSTIMHEVMQKAPCKHISGTGNNSPIYGSYINNSQNAIFCYDVDELRDCKYCTIVGQSQDCMDYFSW
jgi:hypothetical protein